MSLFVISYHYPNCWVKPRSIPLQSYLVKQTCTSVTGLSRRIGRQIDPIRSWNHHQTPYSRPVPVDGTPQGLIMNLSENNQCEKLCTQLNLFNRYVPLSDFSKLHSQVPSRATSEVGDVLELDQGSDKQFAIQRLMEDIGE